MPQIPDLTGILGSPAPTPAPSSPALAAMTAHSSQGALAALLRSSPVPPTIAAPATGPAGYMAPWQFVRTQTGQIMWRGSLASMEQADAAAPKTTV